MLRAPYPALQSGRRCFFSSVKVKTQDFASLQPRMWTASETQSSVYGSIPARRLTTDPPVTSGDAINRSRSAERKRAAPSSLRPSASSSLRPSAIRRITVRSPVHRRPFLPRFTQDYPTLPNIAAEKWPYLQCTQ